MMLDDDSKKFMVINTHKGLFRYIRMPFGTSLWQQFFSMSWTLFCRGPNVLCYLNDILITGETDQEHIHNLEEVLN